MPAQLRQQLIDGLATGFGMRLADPDAFGHALVFCLLALLVRIGRPRDPLLVHLSCWLLVGAATEVLQLLTPDRSPEAGDWLIAAIGTTLGLALAETGLLIRRRLQRARKAARPPPLGPEPRD
jgi:VanZ family protein